MSSNPVLRILVLIMICMAFLLGACRDPEQSTTDTVPSTYIFEARKNQDGRVNVQGYVPDQASRELVVTTLQSLFGDQADSQALSVAEGGASYWTSAVTSGLTALDRVQSGHFSIRDMQIELTGTAENEDARQIIETAFARLPGEFSYAVDIKEPDTSQTSVSQCDTYVVNLRTGTLLFDTDSSEIQGTWSFDVLNQLATAMRECPNLRLEVAGHADASHTEAYNLPLSGDRANAIVSYLTNNGIDVSRIKTERYGELVPVATNETSEGRAKNRRIEFYLADSQ